MSINESNSEHRVSFALADDLLWQAQAGRLTEIGSLTIQPSGRIGPLVEMAMARNQFDGAYGNISTGAHLWRQLDAAINDATISGNGHEDIAGVFPLARHNTGKGCDSVLWDQWAKHAENIAVRLGAQRSLIEGLIGAMVELQDNVFVHSGKPETGLVAYGVSPDAFEFVVADAGMGVLASLRQSPSFADLTDAGAALEAAASDGTSRFGDEAGRGYGIGQLFRALANYQGELRFRSDDHALTLWGDSPSLTGALEIAQKARMTGFVITVRCQWTTGQSARGR